MDPRPVVYVVDDRPANVYLLERILEQADLADVRGFADARVALESITDAVPDLILLDLHMPHLDGFGFLAALAARVADDDFLPILIVTADVDREARRRALRAGASDFLTKRSTRMRSWRGPRTCSARDASTGSSGSAMRA